VCMDGQAEGWIQVQDNSVGTEISEMVPLCPEKGLIPMKRNVLLKRTGLVSLILFFLLILLAPLCIIFFIHTYGMTVPFWDQWALVPLLEKVQTGELSFSDIWVQHNEHRLLFPRLIMLALALLTGWNIIYELYTNFVLAGLILLFLYLLLRKSSYNYFMPWLSIPLTFLVFSPIQFENWIWGWQIQIFLSVLATVVAVWSVNQWPGELKGLLIATGAAVISSYSFNSGLLTWVAVGMLLLMQRERRLLNTSLWFAVFAITVIFYYYGYHKPAHHPSLLFFLNHPYDFIRYIFAYIGSPLGFRNIDVSIATGLFLMAILCTGAIKVWHSSREDFQILLPWLALALYAFLVAAATGIGRSGFGVHQALEGRYTTISTLFVISSFVIVAIWISQYLKINKRLPTKSVIAISFISGLLMFSYILSFSAGPRAMEARKKRIEPGRECLDYADVAADACLKVLHPSAALVRRGAKTLTKMGYLMGVRWPELERVSGGRIHIDYVNNKLYSSYSEKVIDSEKRKTFTIKGWAFDDLKKNSGSRVYLVLRSDGEEIIIPAARSDRADVAKHYGESGYFQSGWSATASTDNLDEGCYTLSMRLLRESGKEYYESDGNKPICFGSTQ